MSADELIRYQESGRRFTAAGVESFVLDQGEGAPVVCMHGVPVSAYLYRKLVPALAARGLRGIAFDLPGLGLAERPEEFDYSWTGLGRWATAAVEALGLEDFHLVVHDIGGPVGFEVAAALPDRVRSLTVLNTIARADGFKKPWVMRPMGVRGVGNLYIGTMARWQFRLLMRMQGIADMSQVTRAELDTHYDLIYRDNNGRTLLKIMRSFEPTPAKGALYAGVLGSAAYPKQVLWGEHDPALRIGDQGVAAQRLTGVAEIVRLPGKHFVPEDTYEAIADRVAALVGG